MGRAESLKECEAALLDKAVKLSVLSATDPLVADLRTESAGSALQLSGMRNEDDQASVARIMYEEAAISMGRAESVQRVVEGVQALRGGTYGKCKYCLGDIPLERMRAVPEATEHVVCPTSKKATKKREVREA